MRRIWIVLVLILVSASAATGVRLHALTECERWIAEYRDSLQHSPTVQRANAARQRLHRYVRHKIQTRKAPARILPARYTRPKMSREEALRKMEFACGAVDLEDPAPATIAASPAPRFVPAASEEGSDPLAPPSNLVAQNTPPPTGGFPIGGVPTTPIYPGGGGSGPGLPGTPGTPGGGGGTEPPPPPPPPPAQTPEPGSLVLLATGVVGAAGMVRRRLSARG